MSWFAEMEEIPSEKNGKIFLRRFFGVWRVTVDGYDQSSRYIRTMWRKALTHIPHHARVKRVLVLGLGAGSIINDLHKRFPKCHVTVIEWDPVMIELAKRTKLYPTDHAPRILIGDAIELVPTLKETFDLIVFDLYHGKEPEKRIADSAFMQSLHARLSYAGFLLVNIFRDTSMLDGFMPLFSRYGTWRFRFNTLALFRPTGYSTYRGEEGYLKRHADGKQNGIFIQTPSAGTGALMPGLKWTRGFIRFEGYFSDHEPACDPKGPRRLVIWQPFRSSVSRPRGWMRFPLPVNVRRTGHVLISDPENYWKDWNENVKRQRAKWLKTQPLTIEEVSLEEFVAGYREARPWFKMRDQFVKQIRRSVAQHSGLVHLLGARDPHTGKVRAGFAVLDIPESKASIHLTSFFHPSLAHSGVGTGLVDAWFRHGIANGIRYLDFDIFWVFGEPREWRGFSKFKAQFGTRLIDYPTPFLKIVGGKSLR